MVPLLDLKRQYQTLQAEIEPAVLQLLASGQYILGPAVDEFEAACAESIGARHAIGVANGTDALQIALQALGVGAGDEVITSPFTFFASAEVVSRLGATPVFCDIEADTYNLDPNLLESLITPKTRAILPVHLFGHPAAMSEINAIAKRHNLPVLEDAAQAWGAGMSVSDTQSTLSPDNTQSTLKQCGALAEIAGFSFYPTKNLGACGEGGLITTDDDDLAAHVRKLRVHGERKRYYHDEIGYNSRLHALQAKILHLKLPHAKSWNDARRRHAAWYQQALNDLPIQLPSERDGAHHVYHQYTIQFPRERFDREKICRALTEAEIGWAIIYPVCLHLQPVYESLGVREGSLPVAERAAGEVLSLPIFPELREDELETVARAVRAACALSAV